MHFLPRKTFLSIISIAAVLVINATSAAANELEIGIQLFETRQFAEAKRVLTALAEKNPDDPTIAVYLGRIYLTENAYDESIDWFKKAVGLDESSSDSHLWLGRAYGEKAQRASIFKKPFLAGKVKNEFLKAVECDSNNVDARSDLMQFYLMAPGIMGGSDQKAKEQADAIKMIDRKSGHRAWGYIYENKEQYDLAKKEYLKAIEADPEDVDSYFRLGYFYNRIEDYDKAIETFERILGIDPEKMNAYYQIGRSSVFAGRNLDRAEECFKEYMQIEPGNDDPSLAWAHYRLGMVYEKKARKEQAEAEYETALKLDPEHKQAKKALKDLE